MTSVQLKSSYELYQGSLHSSWTNLELLQIRYAYLNDDRNMTEMQIQANNKLEEVESNQSKCDICLKETSVEMTDEIVLCDLCNCAVHQQCYRRDLEK